MQTSFVRLEDERAEIQKQKEYFAKLRVDFLPDGQKVRNVPLDILVYCELDQALVRCLYLFIPLFVHVCNVKVGSDFIIQDDDSPVEEVERGSCKYCMCLCVVGRCVYDKVFPPLF